MIIEGHELIDKYRRLRILYNRVGIFGKKIFYSYWFEHVFQTKLVQENYQKKLKVEKN